MMTLIYNSTKIWELTRRASGSCTHCIRWNDENDPARSFRLVGLASRMLRRNVTRSTLLAWRCHARYFSIWNMMEYLK